MDNEKILKATYGSDKTPLIIKDIKLPCYVLENGQRVLSGRGILKSLGFDQKTAGSELVKMSSNQAIVMFLDRNVIENINNPIKFIRKGAGGSAPYTYGYEATILVDLCNAIIEAKNKGLLDKKYEIAAIQADILLRAVAKTGIIALIDEVTGYQHDREKDELQKILKAYISEELLPWQKRFPDIYYTELFRLNGWDYTVENIKKRPSCIGKWTNTIIYEELPKDVLKTLKERTPKSEKGNRLHRYHQLLTQDVGEPNLNNQIQQILMLFKISDTMEDFWTHFKKAQERDNGQLKIPFKFDKKGHTIAPVEYNNLSEFNQNIKKALDYNSNND